jgi:hypothetical protein
MDNSAAGQESSWLEMSQSEPQGGKMRLLRAIRSIILHDMLERIKSR